jgi:hypothetical protein
MFKEVGKYFTTQRIIVLLVFIVLMWGLLSYSSTKGSVHDLMSDGHMPSGDVPAGAGHPAPDQASAQAVGSVPAPTNGYTVKSSANPSDLLPSDQNNQWSALNPNAMNKGDILMPDLLQAGYHIGLDTIGQTLRNPNLQLRSDPLIQKSDIGPWNQSTIEPDIGRVPLELGQGSQ